MTSIHQLPAALPEVAFGPTFGPTAGDLLGIVVDVAAEERHAAYPDARRALCGRPVIDLERAPGDIEPPDCDSCRSVAARFDRIDSSAPRSWFRGH